MNPQDKVTWPQLIMEFVIYWRIQFLKDYKNIKHGYGWSNQIQKQVRQLTQQAYAICNYFPHPDDEPLVVPAFKNFFRRHRPLTIGTYRKTRFTTKGNRKVCNLTQGEKDVVLGLAAELSKLIDQRNVFQEVKISTSPALQTTDTTVGVKPKPKINRFDDLIELEKQVSNG